MILKGRLHFAMAKIAALSIDDHDVSEHHVDFRTSLKKVRGGSQRAGQILLITIQVGKNVPASPPQAAVDGIVHALIFLHENLGATILRQPIERSIVRARVLHDMFGLDPLVSHRSKAELEPGGTAEAGGNDGEGSTQNNV